MTRASPDDFQAVLSRFLPQGLGAPPSAGGASTSSRLAADVGSVATETHQQNGPRKMTHSELRTPVFDMGPPPPRRPEEWRRDAEARGYESARRFDATPHAGFGDTFGSAMSAGNVMSFNAFGSGDLQASSRSYADERSRSFADDPRSRSYADERSCSFADEARDRSFVDGSRSFADEARGRQNETFQAPNGFSPAQGFQAPLSGFSQPCVSQPPLGGFQAPLSGAQVRRRVDLAESLLGAGADVKTPLARSVATAVRDLVEDSARERLLNQRRSQAETLKALEARHAAQLTSERATCSAATDAAKSWRLRCDALAKDDAAKAESARVSAEAERNALNGHVEELRTALKLAESRAVAAAAAAKHDTARCHAALRTAVHGRDALVKRNVDEAKLAMQTAVLDFASRMDKAPHSKVLALLETGSPLKGSPTKHRADAAAAALRKAEQACVAATTTAVTVGQGQAAARLRGVLADRDAAHVFALSDALAEAERRASAHLQNAVDSALQRAVDVALNVLCGRTTRTKSPTPPRRRRDDEHSEEYHLGWLEPALRSRDAAFTTRERKLLTDHLATIEQGRLDSDRFRIDEARRLSDDWEKKEIANAEDALQSAQMLSDSKIRCSNAEQRLFDAEANSVELKTTAAELRDTVAELRALVSTAEKERKASWQRAEEAAALERLFHADEVRRLQEKCDADKAASFKVGIEDGILEVEKRHETTLHKEEERRIHDVAQLRDELRRCVDAFSGLKAKHQTLLQRHELLANDAAFADASATAASAQARCAACSSTAAVAVFEVRCAAAVAEARVLARELTEAKVVALQSHDKVQELQRSNDALKSAVAQGADSLQAAQVEVRDLRAEIEALHSAASATQKALDDVKTSHESAQRAAADSRNVSAELAKVALSDLEDELVSVRRAAAIAESERCMEAQRRRESARADDASRARGDEAVLQESSNQLQAYKVMAQESQAHASNLEKELDHVRGSHDAARRAHALDLEARASRGVELSEEGLQKVRLAFEREKTDLAVKLQVESDSRLQRLRHDVEVDRRAQRQALDEALVAQRRSYDSEVEVAKVARSREIRLMEEAHRASVEAQHAQLHDAIRLLKLHLSNARDHAVTELRPAMEEQMRLALEANDVAHARTLQSASEELERRCVADVRAAVAAAERCAMDEKRQAEANRLALETSEHRHRAFLQSVEQRHRAALAPLRADAQRCAALQQQLEIAAGEASAQRSTADALRKALDVAVHSKAAAAREADAGARRSRHDDEALRRQTCAVDVEKVRGALQSQLDAARSQMDAANDAAGAAQAEAKKLRRALEASDARERLICDAAREAHRNALSPDRNALSPDRTALHSPEPGRFRDGFS